MYFEHMSDYYNFLMIDSVEFTKIDKLAHQIIEI